MIGQIFIVILFAGLIYFEGKKLVSQKYYYDLGVILFIYALAFYYAYGYMADWDVYNPLDTFLWLFEPLGTKLFIDILGI